MTTPLPRMTTYDVARVLRVTEATVRRYVAYGLPHERALTGGTFRFVWEDVEAWLRRDARGRRLAVEQDDTSLCRTRFRRLE